MDHWFVDLINNNNNYPSGSRLFGRNVIHRFEGQMAWHSCMYVCMQGKLKMCGFIPLVQSSRFENTLESVTPPHWQSEKTEQRSSANLIREFSFIYSRAVDWTSFLFLSSDNRNKKNVDAKKVSFKIAKMADNFFWLKFVEFCAWNFLWY
jgi:hypothetical protein